MNLSLLIIIPLITGVAVLFCKGLKQVRTVALIGSALQLLMAFALLGAYWNARIAGNTQQMLFQFRTTWFAPLNIEYFVGVDGISIAMILLTAFVVLAGVLVSWKMPAGRTGGEMLSKEFFFLLLLLSAGAYGFFISLDLFMMFFFLEVAVIPKFLL